MSSETFLVDHEFGAGGYGDDVLAELAAVERRRDHVALEAVLFAHGLDDVLVHGQDVEIDAVHHVLHNKGFAGSDPQATSSWPSFIMLAASLVEGV